MKVYRFMEIENLKGATMIINVDYVIALRRLPAGSNHPAKSQLLLAVGDSKMDVDVTDTEAGRIESWLLEHASS
jgi:hypothetical protein